MTSPADQTAGLEESGRFTPRFDVDGLMPCVTVDAASRRCPDGGLDERRGAGPHAGDRLVHYWSRSRQALWGRAKRRERCSAWSSCAPTATRTRCSSRRESASAPAHATPGGRPASIAASRSEAARSNGLSQLAPPPRTEPARQAVAIYSRICSASRSTSSIRCFTTSPIETIPASLPSTTTGR